MDIDSTTIDAAAHRIAPYIRKTPVWRLAGRQLGLQAAAADCEVWLKLEHLQVSGCFKARGMFNRLLSHEIPASGVIIASGGNAGIATALAARELGTVAEVFVHRFTSPAKQARLRALGARVVVAGEAYSEALEACLARQRETGALLTHAYDQPEVVAGAGTLARELETQMGSTPGRVLVSVGGGGLVGGIAAWFAGRSTVVALEPELAPTLHRAREAGQPVDVQVSGVAVDSLGAKRIGTIAWAVTRRHVAESILLSDESIGEAQRFMWDELKLAVEPAAALPLAALRSGAVRPKAGEQVALVVCGANLDPAALAP